MFNNSIKKYTLICTLKPVINKNFLNIASINTATENKRLLESERSDGATDLGKVVQLPKFTPAECTKIIDLVNNKTTDELLSYEISKGRASKLHAWRSRNGPLRNPEDILNVDGFGLKVATKFYKSLLEAPKNAKIPSLTSNQSQRTRTSHFITPMLDDSEREQIRSCVSARVGVSSITWARLELAEDNKSPCLLSHWQHHELSDKKLHLSDLVQRCLYVMHQIPAADCYILENPQIAQAASNPGSVDQQNVNIQKAQVIAIISYALSARAASLPQNAQQNQEKKNFTSRLYYLRRFLTARLFNHLVGTERVSSESTVLKLMRMHYNSDDHNHDDFKSESPQQSESGESLRSIVQFPSELRQMFSQANRYHREFLGQALLLNLAFVRLALLQDVQSLAIITRGNKKSNEL